MTNPAGSPSRRGGGVVALLLAILFLAVLGGSVGYLVGRQVKAHRDLSSNQQQVPPDGSATDGATSTGTPDSGGTHCPQVSERDAKKPLIQVRYIKTHRSEVWVCRDPDGGLWYQGHDLSGALDSNTHGLLLSGVTKQEGGRYEASNTDEHGTTNYYVYADKLVIEQNGQQRDPEPAVESTG
jgi:hypothetical protein